MLAIDNLTKYYHRSRVTVTALANFSLSASSGEMVAVNGPSGCGKTTLLLAAGGLLQPDQGTVIVSGQHLYALSSEERARFRASHIGFVFQQFHLVPYLSVLENVLSATLATSREAPRERAMALLERFQLSHRLYHVPDELSTGERQRCALARALLNEPKLILADEPTGNLDDQNADVVLSHLQTHAEEGGTVLLVTHDREAAARASRTITLETPAAVA